MNDRRDPGDGFLSAIPPCGHPAQERLPIFLNILPPKLPAPKEEAPPKGVLKTIGMNSYRAQVSMKMAPDDINAFVEPPPPGGGNGEPDMDGRSNVINQRRCGSSAA